MPKKSAPPTSDTQEITIFDTVFRIIVQRMPQLLPAVINEIFHTDYAKDTPIEQIRNEQITLLGKIITDAVLRIGGHIYHLECQSTPDGTMAIRMVEYDFAIALEQARRDGKPYRVKFPSSAVLYLRHPKDMPDTLAVDVELPDGNHFQYKTPVAKVQRYRLDEILQKKLLLFLPYYIMRYEKDFAAMEKDMAQQQALLADLRAMADYLKVSAMSEPDNPVHADLAHLITRISDYLLRNHPAVKKEAKKIMRESRILLPSEIMFRWGERKGKREGKRKGEIAGRKAANESTALNMLRDHLPAETIAKYTSLPPERIAELAATL